MPHPSLHRIGLVLSIAIPFLAGCSSLSPQQLGAPVGDAGKEGGSARMMAMGEHAMQAGDPRTAALLFQRAAAGAKGDPQPATRLGDALLADGRVQDALDAYRVALRIDTYAPDATRGFARAMIALNRPDAAAAQVQAVLDRMPDDPKLLTTQGVVMDMLGQHDTAQSRYRQALAHVPDDPATLNDLALSQALSGQFDSAVATLKPLAERPSASARSRQNLAVVYALMGNDTAAERLFRIDLSDADVRANMQYFGALRGLGSSAQAAQVLARPGPTVLPGPLAAVDRVPMDRADAPRPAAPPAPAAPAAPSAPASPTPGPKALLPPQAAMPPSASSGRQAAASGAAPVGPTVATAAALPPTAPFATSPVAAAALEETDLRDGRAPLGDWVADLGKFPSPAAAEARWQTLRRSQPKLVGGALHLAGSGDGPQPLLVGPFASEDVARSFCDALGARQVTCETLHL